MIKLACVIGSRYRVASFKAATESKKRKMTNKVKRLLDITFHAGQELWCSGYRSRLMLLRWWVQIPVPYSEWEFFTLICYY